MLKYKFVYLLSFVCTFLSAQPSELAQNNIVWTSQSKNSGESMPVGGGDIGLNVWVEHGELLIYVSRSGTFDENNQFLKLGRLRVKLSPNVLNGSSFKQELKLKEGRVVISATDANYSSEISIWADVYRPVVHVDINNSKALIAEVAYESWRAEDRIIPGRANWANSYRWEKQGKVSTYKDSIDFKDNGVIFFHRNRNEKSVFDLTVTQQYMDSVKSQLFDPLKNLTFGGYMIANGLIANGITDGKYLDTDFKAWSLKNPKPVKKQSIELYLNQSQANSLTNWQSELKLIRSESEKNAKTASAKSIEWWTQYWNRSFIFIDTDKSQQNTEIWQAGRNYQLMRFMLGCNVFGSYPTKFNGGLFTYDPSCTDTSRHYSPDFRNWGGGTFTAQNQRLVYFPMLRSGDFEMMKPQFEFYRRALRNAELRSEVYWGHKGACFTEQLENFGLPNYAEYSSKRPANFDKGVEYNAWLEYVWDTSLEFCLMILETERYAKADITEYMPLIESCLTFFDEHYQYLAKQRGRKALDGNGHLILYPGSGAETFKMAYNSTSTIAALQTVSKRLLELPDNYLDTAKRRKYSGLLKRIPPLNYRQIDGHTCIAPAASWERLNNVETPQLYPVFPWGIYGVGKPGLDTAINTWRYDKDGLKFRSHIGWKQDNIWAARLGLTDEALKLNVAKLKDSGRRFPAFWGPGFDWTPDHNWGGAGMIGLQEMLLQTDGSRIMLFPAWPKNANVHFKLYAPYNTTVEAELKNGKIEMLKVVPESRAADVINMLK